LFELKAARVNDSVGFATWAPALAHASSAPVQASNLNFMVFLSILFLAGRGRPQPPSARIAPVVRASKDRRTSDGSARGM
jgi:hypothetical protein